MNRLVILPDESLEPLAATLRVRLEAIAREISAENLAALLDPQAAALIENLALSSKSDAMFWGAGEGCFPAVWASEAARNLVSRATADRREGLVARVFESGRGTFSGECESFSPEWTNLARLCGVSSISLAGVPVRLAGRVVGVLSLFKREAELDGSAMGPLGRLAEIAASLAEARILRECLGMEIP